MYKKTPIFYILYVLISSFVNYLLMIISRWNRIMKSSLIINLVTELSQRS